MITDVYSIGDNKYNVVTSVMPGNYNRFENGTFIVNGEGFVIQSNNPEISINLPIRGVITVLDNADDDFQELVSSNSLIGEEFFAVDDDDKGNIEAFTLPLPENVRLVTEAVKKEFKIAYIDIDDAYTNFHPIIPFILNGRPPHPSDGYKTLTDGQDFWAIRLVAAYQPEEELDDDPNSEEVTLGEYKSKDVYIFMETLRDNNRSLIESSSAHARALGVRFMLQERDSVVAHEIGHAPKEGLIENDHEELGLMGNTLGPLTDIDFTAETINRFRNANKWCD